MPNAKRQTPNAKRQTPNARSRSRSIAKVGIVLAASLWVGCKSKNVGVIPDFDIHSRVRNEVDLGVIFSHSDSRFCLALEKVGLTGNDDIHSIVTSCKCVSCRVVSFRSSMDRIEKAIEILITADAELQATTSLAVDVSIALGNERTKTISLFFVHTKPLEMELSNET